MLTLEQAQQYAEEVVAERGEDFVYNTPQDPDNAAMCAYVSQQDERFPEGSMNPAKGSTVTGCLVGEILKRADLLTDTIAGSSLSIGTLVRGGLVPVENEETRTFLTILQLEQDTGTSWGIALKTAKEEVTTANHDSL